MNFSVFTFYILTNGPVIVITLYVLFAIVSSNASRILSVDVFIVKIRANRKKSWNR